MIKKHATGKTSLNRPGLFLCGTIFDLHKLPRLVNLPIEYINNTTLVPTIKRLFRTDTIYPQLVGYSTNFKICPLCLKENKLPMIHVFNNITTCLEHNIKLLDKCICGHKIILFSPLSDTLCCPICNKPYEKLEYKAICPESEEYSIQKFYVNSYKEIIYENINLVNDYEDLAEGFEARLQYMTECKNISTGEFKHKFGYDALNMKNGHGPINLSLAKILDILQGLGCTPQKFRDLHINDNYKKILILHDNKNGCLDSTCPNIYCLDYKILHKGNICFYGRKKFPNGEVKVEEFCKTCGTRFFGNDIIQSYDYNPGLRKSDIEKARARIIKWQFELTKACENFIKERIPITLTGSFKKADIPIGKTYFIDRLGLIAILEKYAQIQREDLVNWSQELDSIDLADFQRRIYKPRKIK